MDILKANTEDATAILELQKLAYRSEAGIYNDFSIPPLTQTARELEAEFNTHTFLKACHGSDIVGSVRACLRGNTCFIGRLIVHPFFQRKGIGTKLMGRIEKLFSSAERYEIFTGNLSQGNLKLYHGLGYKPFREETLSEKVRLVYLEKSGVP